MALTLRLSAILVSFLVALSFQVLLGLRTSTGSICRGGCVVAMASEAGSSGYYRAKTPLTNKGTGFSVAERTKFNMRGLLPAGAPQSLDLKVEIAMEQLSLKSSPIEKYIFLHTIMDSDETLYYAILIKHTSKVMPFVYTPTVGEACQKWSTIYRHQPRGVYISSDDAGHVREIFQNQINKDVKVIVMTDGERILGLGDLGSNGMGIPIGKLALYTACAGIDPSQCLPIQVDVGTTTKAIRDDPAYFGLRRDRDRSPAYDALIAEIFEAAQEAFGKNVLIQFEDFGNSNAFRLLEHYQTNACCFNDDIQGTASVVLAGVLSSLPLAGKKDISEHTFLFYGAGEAGVGIANMVAMAIAKVKGCSIDQAQKQIWLVDSKGLVTNARSDVAEMKKTAAHKLPYTHAPPASLSQSDKESPLLSAIKAVKPTALIGVSAQGGAFDAQVLKTMADINSSPLIFALSNPTSKAECTALQAYEGTEGRCIFASGSPFDPVTLKDGRSFTPGQGNNAFIFPGVGLGSVASCATTLTDEDFYVAAETLAKLVSKESLVAGCAYPPLSEIRDVSACIAAAVAENVCKTGRSALAKPYPKVSRPRMQACRGFLSD